MQFCFYRTKASSASDAFSDFSKDMKNEARDLKKDLKQGMSDVSDAVDKEASGVMKAVDKDVADVTDELNPKKRSDFEKFTETLTTLFPVWVRA